MADGAVRFPDSGRLMPLAAQRRSAKSCRESSFVANSRVDRRLANACMMVSPRVRSGLGSEIVSRAEAVMNRVVL